MWELSCFSHIQLFVTMWTLAHHAPLSMGFSRQEYWCGLPCPSSEDLPDPGIEPAPLMSPAFAGVFLPLSANTYMPWHFHVQSHHASEQKGKGVIVRFSIQWCLKHCPRTTSGSFLSKLLCCKKFYDRRLWNIRYLYALPWWVFWLAHLWAPLSFSS